MIIYNVKFSLILQIVMIQLRYNKKRGNINENKNNLFGIRK